MTKIIENETVATTDKAPVAKKVATKAKKVKAESAPAFKAVSAFAMRTILAPIITEKSATLGSKNVLVFRVASDATRVGIAQAIRELYGVQAVKVNVITVRPKAITFGRTRGTIKGYKKAMVTLPAGKTIDVFASV